MNLYNFHTHTHFCDGNSEPQKYVLSAIDKGFKSLGFSAHAPINLDTKWNLKIDNVNNYLKEINRLKNLYSDKVEIFLGFETDYVPTLTTDFDKQKQLFNLDYVIGAIHLVKSTKSKDVWFIDGPEENYINGLAKVFNNDIKTAVRVYFEQLWEMIATQKPDVIGHFDKIKMNNKNRFFEESDYWYKELIRSTINIIEKSGCIVEINTRGIYKKRSESFFPDIKILEELYLKKIPIVISTDAHAPEELDGYYSETYDIVKSIGFKHLNVLSANKNWDKVKI